MIYLGKNKWQLPQGTYTTCVCDAAIPASDFILVYNYKGMKLYSCQESERLSTQHPALKITELKPMSNK